MRLHELSFANFILRFGEEVLIDYVEEMVLPAFLNEERTRKHGETEFRFYNTKLRQIGTEDGQPVLAITGHFVKDTKLRREQIFRPGQGLVHNAREMESAPSSFFVLILNNHRMLYFAETGGAPTLETFGATAQAFLREEWHRYIRERIARENVTRRGAERTTIRQMGRRIPAPNLAVVRVAGQDAITDTIARFRKIKQLRFKLLEPNDEIDAAKAVAAVEEAFRPTEPSRLEVLVSGPRGLNKDEVEQKVVEISEGQNTEIIVDGEDEAGLKMKADNDEFALSVPVANPPEDDEGLSKALFAKYKTLAQDGKVKGLKAIDKVVDKLQGLKRLL